jgi:hypothetical protein
MMADNQIGGWMRPEEQDEFMRYLEQFHLGPGAVAALLILKELRLGRLPRLKALYPMPRGTGRERVSARPHDLAVKADFNAHAASFGIKPNPAAAMVFRAELKERSLERWMESG